MMNKSTLKLLLRPLPLVVASSIVSLIYLGTTIQSVEATQIKEAGADAEIVAFISQADLSRIKVMADRVASVKVAEGEIDAIYEDETGDVYIRPLKQSGEPLSLFVTTEKGFTYQLLLTPRSIPSEQIFISNPDAIIRAVKNSVSGYDAYHESIINLIGAIRQNRTPLGYVKSKKPFSSATLFTGKEWVGEALSYKNESNEAVALTIEQFMDEAVCAISLDKESLEPGELVIIYKVREVRS